MTFGFIAKEFESPLKEIVKGKTVLDLGAGDLVVANQLLRLGAKHIVAVDRDGFNGRHYARMEFHHMYFDQFMAMKKRPKWDVLFMSWPCNWDLPGVQQLLDVSKKIVIISKCTDGSMCGTPKLWRYLSELEVMWCIPHPKNVLTIYNNKEEKRKLTGEEEAGIYQDDKEYSFWEVHEYTRPLSEP